MGNSNNINSAGSPNIAASPLVVPAASPAPSGWSQVVAAYDSMCAISNVGDVWCMGNGTSGQTGQGNTTTIQQLQKVTFPGTAGRISKMFTNSGSNEYIGRIAIVSPLE